VWRREAAFTDGEPWSIYNVDSMNPEELEGRYEIRSVKEDGNNFKTPLKAWFSWLPCRQGLPTHLFTVHCADAAASQHYTLTSNMCKHVVGFIASGKARHSV
jgi:hypothetical protein